MQIDELGEINEQTIKPYSSLPLVVAVSYLDVPNTTLIQTQIIYL